MDNYSHHGSRRSPVEYDDLHSLRRRTSPQAELSSYDQDSSRFERDPFADAFRARNSHLDYNGSLYGQVTGLDGLDTIPLTPSMLPYEPRSSSVFPSVFPTSTRFSDAQRCLDAQDVIWRPGGSRTESEGSVHTVKSASSSATVVSSSGVVLAESGLGVPYKFTNKWPKPLPLKNTGGKSSFSDFSPVGEELTKSVDAVLLERRIGDVNGLLGFEWFSRWTGFKWCLLFSVLSVLVYGIAGLSCAIGIWFRSELSFNRSYPLQIFTPSPSLAQCRRDVRFRQRCARLDYPRLLCSRLCCSCWAYWNPPVFKTHPRYICSSSVAMLHFNVRHRLHNIQTRHICA